MKCFGFKVWRWWLGIIIKDLGCDARIAFLANLLIKECQDSGRQVKSPEYGANFGSIFMFAHENLNTIYMSVGSDSKIDVALTTKMEVLNNGSK